MNKKQYTFLVLLVIIFSSLGGFISNQLFDEKLIAQQDEEVDRHFFEEIYSKKIYCEAIECNNIRMSDDKGNTRVYFGHDSKVKKSTCLFVYDTIGNALIGMLSDSLGNPFFGLNSSNSDKCINLDIDSNGASFSMIDDKQNTLFHINTRIPELSFGLADKNRMNISFDDHSSIFRMYDDGGIVRLASGIVYLENYEDAKLGNIGSASVPAFSIWDKQEKIIWSAP